MTEEERKKAAEANLAETNEAHRLAAERRAQEANQPPLVNTLANSIKSKLEQLPPEKQQ